MKTILSIAFATMLTLISRIQQIALFCRSFPADCFGEMPISPLRYRLIQTWLSTSAPNDVDAFALATLIHILITPLLLTGVYLWLKRWTAPNQALLGVWITAGTLMYAFHIYGLDITLIIEGACMVGALLSIRYPLVAYVLIALASVNRGTGIFVALACAVYAFEQWGRVKAIGGILVSVGFIGVIYLILSQNPTYLTALENPFAYNLVNLSSAILLWIAFFPLLLLVIWQYRACPLAVKRLLWVAVPYVALTLASSSWDEFSRYSITIMPLILPVILYQPSIKTSN